MRQRYGWGFVQGARSHVDKLGVGIFGWFSRCYFMDVLLSIRFVHNFKSNLGPTKKYGPACWDLQPQPYSQSRSEPIQRGWSSTSRPLGM